MDTNRKRDLPDVEVSSVVGMVAVSFIPVKKIASILSNSSLLFYSRYKTKQSIHTCYLL